MIRNLVRTVDRLAGGRVIDALQNAVLNTGSIPSATCPSCGHEGRFAHFGAPLRTGVLCPSCGSLERHRLLALALKRGEVTLAGRSVLHFAPEASVARLVAAQEPSSYRTSRYPDRESADLCLDIEAIDLPDGSFDVVICSHLLEHVDDSKALSEIRRVLAPGGLLVAMVPIIEGWHRTYEDSAIADDDGRTRHFGQFDHIRYYGADFRDRVRAAGFSLDEFTAGGADSVTYRLSRGEKVFLAHK